MALRDDGLAGAGVHAADFDAYRGSFRIDSGAQRVAIRFELTLRESGARSGSGLRQSKARSTLVITEMALALILLAGRRF